MLGSGSPLRSGVTGENVMQRQPQRYLTTHRVLLLCLPLSLEILSILHCASCQLTRFSAVSPDHWNRGSMRGEASRLFPGECLGSRRDPTDFHGQMMQRWLAGTLTPNAPAALPAPGAVCWAALSWQQLTDANSHTGGVQTGEKSHRRCGAWWRIGTQASLDLTLLHHLWAFLPSSVRNEFFTRRNRMIPSSQAS